MIMLARVVEYLRSNGVAFRLMSYPAPETQPSVGYLVRPEGALMVETRALIVDGRPSLACVPSEEGINLLSLRAALGAELIEEGGLGDLPWPFENAGAPMPPFGRMFGLPVFVDDSLANAATIGFAIFGPNDFIEMTYDDFARLEQPRVASFVGAGELPAPPLH